MRKTTLVLLTFSALFAAGFFAVGRVRADEDGSDYSPVIQRLIEKFNLDGDEVEDVFAEARQEKQSQTQARFEEKLAQLVSDGRLTEEQKQAVLTKREELRLESQNWRDLAVGERRKLMEEHRSQMQLWAKEEGIDLSLIFGPGFGDDKGLGAKNGSYRRPGN